MRFKQIIVLVLTVACLCSTCFATTVSAETTSTHSLVSGVSPLYDIVENEFSDLSINGTKAECKSQAYGDNTAKITVEQTLKSTADGFGYGLMSMVHRGQELKTVVLLVCLTQKPILQAANIVSKPCVH